LPAPDANFGICDASVDMNFRKESGSRALFFSRVHFARRAFRGLRFRDQDFVYPEDSASTKPAGISALENAVFDRKRARSVTLIVVFVFLGFGTRNSLSAQNANAGRKLAFLVGVKVYDHADLKNLDFPENDVEDLAALLKSDGFETIVLTTSRGKKSDQNKPTAANIRSRLKAILGGATKQDLIIVGLAGHGIQPLASDESYFCPADANPVVKDDRPIAPERLVSVGEILAQMSDSGIGYKLLLVDACRNDPNARSARHRGVDHVNVAALPSQTGVLLSCSQGEFSFEDKSLGGGHGVFFYHVIQGLKGAAKDANSQVTWDGLGLYVRTEVPATVARLYGKEGGEQSPNAIGNLRGVPAALARITGTGEPNPPLPAAKPPELLFAPFDKERAATTRKAWAQYRQIDEERKNSLNMEFVLIPAGRFSMGTKESEADLLRAFPYARKEWVAGEWPMHAVTISRPFYLGKYEVTKGQFQKFVEATHYTTDAENDGTGGFGYTGDKDHPWQQRPTFTWRDWGVEQSPNSPVVNVSWNDAVAFCEWLSQKDGTSYRLPTEAEWEYACRAGTTGRSYNGNDAERLTEIGNVWDAAVRERVATARNSLNSSDRWPFTSPVGEFQANNFGLYDMIGNAWEWCSDWYGNDYYLRSPQRDPTGPNTGTHRIQRGGSWYNYAVRCRSACRSVAVPTSRQCSAGFRVAQSVLP
jgi:formylglycine-generating enzyme required for sulfatase activity